MKKTVAFFLAILMIFSGFMLSSFANGNVSGDETSEVVTEATTAEPALDETTEETIVEEPTIEETTTEETTIEETTIEETTIEETTIEETTIEETTTEETTIEETTIEETTTEETTIEETTTEETTVEETTTEEPTTEEPTTEELKGFKKLWNGLRELMLNSRLSIRVILNNIIDFFKDMFNISDEEPTTEATTATVVIELLDADNNKVDTLTFDVAGDVELNEVYLRSLVEERGYVLTGSIVGDSIGGTTAIGGLYAFRAYL